MSLPEELQRIVERQGGSAVRENEPMARHTTFGIGGPADYFVMAEEETVLRSLVRCAREADVPVFALGSGSNILVSDEGIRGVVVENNVRALRASERRSGALWVRAAAGASFAGVARWTARRGIRGLEWAAGIPGTLGGAVVYNAGAYGGCLADVLTEIRVLDPHGEERTIPAEDLGLGYRSSAFTRGLLRERVILELRFQLQAGESAAALARIAELESRRKASTPRGRNAGSVFKNPPEHPAWWLIDKVGLRGHRIGGAQISEKHTNYFLNVGETRAAEMAALMEEARRRVREQFGVELETEVALVGEGFA